ncbi:hypothetical protein ABLN97_01215 [Mycobacterium tuberculosis]
MAYGPIAPTALVVMLPLIWGMNQLGWHAAAQVPLWIESILLYVLLPLDLRFGPDGQNPPDEVTDRLENDKYYRWLDLHLHPVPVPQRGAGRIACSPPQTSVGSALTAP